MREDRSFLSDIMGDSKMENNINNKTSSDFSPDNFVPFAVTEEEKAWLSEYREKDNAVFSSGKPVTEEGLETIKELTSQNTYVFLYAKYKKAQKTIKVKASVAAFFALFATLIGTSIIEVILFTLVFLVLRLFLQQVPLMRPLREKCMIKYFPKFRNEKN